MTTLTVVLVSLLLATPAVISWLWLVIVPYRVARFCPEECWCDVGGYFVDCSNKSLHSIPSIYLTHVQELVLDDNSITCLENDSFISKGLTELCVLVLERCGLQTIEVGAFNGLTKLTILSMRQNGIGEITQGTFEMMSGLEYLGLGYNKIEHLDVDVFCGLINLQHVNLEGNELLLLHPDIFLGLPKIKSLCLGRNGGLQIPTDRHFITSHSLKTLYIYGCNISSLSIETFANVSALEVLDLRYNNLRSIDVNILRPLTKLSALHLYGNPLWCDCQLKEVWRWCQDHNIRTEFSALVCYTLSEEKHVGWRGLEEIQCVQDNISNKAEYKQERDKQPDKGILQIYKEERIYIGIIVILLFFFLILFGTTANVMLMIIITCNKDMRTIPNMYSLNLAISDTILLTFLIATIIATLLNRLGIISEHILNSSLYFVQLSSGLSSYSVALLSIQRYKMIVSPFHDRVSSKPTWCVTVATICGVWVVAALISIPTAFSNLYCFDPLLESRNVAYLKRVITFDLMAFCVLPLFVTAFSYIMAARHLVKSADLLSEGTQNPQLKARKNIALFMLGLTVVFVISYVPVYVIEMYVNLNATGKLLLIHFNHFHEMSLDFDVAIIVSFCFLMINSALNPVALFSTSLTFRKYLKRYLCCCCKANSSLNDIELQRRNRV